MNPVNQEFMHLPEEGQQGDCHRAVIASLLEIPISEVPHFAQDSQGDVDKYWTMIQDFLGNRGYAYLTIPADGGAMFFGDHPGVYHEISGPDPRGGSMMHAVIGKDGEVVFDPHPSRAGLSGDTSDWEYGFIVLADPHHSRK